VNLAPSRDRLFLEFTTEEGLMNGAIRALALRFHLVGGTAEIAVFINVFQEATNVSTHQAIRTIITTNK
jgi:hypothetical protein